MLNDLLLLSGIDIPFPQAQISIHQPRIKEISYIGEESFFLGCEFLNFSKNILSEEDKNNLKNKSNFEIFMSVIKDKSLAIQKNKINATMVLSLMFPEYKIHFERDSINIIDEEMNKHIINDKNFEAFKEIIVNMFCLKQDIGNGPVYNPGGRLSEEIAAKLNRGRAKAAKSNGETKKISILSKYISILSVGQNKDFENLLNYTVYQLFDEFNRFEMKTNFDWHMKAKMAGAKGLEEIENWMIDIHP